MTVAQKFWVERVLGKGGMGVVVAATHLQLGQRVALKFLHAGATDSGEATERFLREARAAVRLRGEHVGRVLDVGKTDDGAPYIVMEYLDGRDLASLLATGGVLPVATAVDYVLQACLGVGEAHAAGVVHRDLKPSNLFLTRRPEGTPLIKVLDFGIAKARGRMDPRLTESAVMMGSPGYMAPEQLKNARDVDARADVWALGVCLYELITRRRPFDAASHAEMTAKVAIDPPAPLPATLPRGLVAAVMRCLEKAPADRFPDVGALAQAIAPFGSPGAASIAGGVARMVAAGDRRASSTDPVAAVMAATTMSRAAPAPVTAPALRMRRRFWLGVSAGAAMAVVGAAIVIVLLGARGGARPAARAASADAGAAVVVASDAAPAVVASPVDAGVDALADEPAPAVRATRSVGVRSGAGATSAQPAAPKSGGASRGETTTTRPVSDDLDGDGIPDKR